MNNQTSCTTTNSADLETEYTRDTWGRLTKIEKPAGNCVHYEYDSEGRLDKTLLADDCVSTNAAYTSERTYSVDGLLTKVEHFYNTGSKFRQEYEYRADRRLDELINPMSVLDSKEFAYHDDGMLKSIEHEDSQGKEEFDYDDLNRQEEIRRYKDTSSYDTWELTNADQLDVLTKVEDDDSKTLDMVYDDLGRQVKLVSPDSGTTLWLYDEGGNTTTIITAQDASASSVTHTMVFDEQGRNTSIDSDAVDCGTNEEEDIQIVFDSLPTGVSCPTGADCDNLDGRRAYIKTKLWCDTAKSDDSFDQETFFSYDDAGRVTTVYVKDDSGRTAETNYTWTDNGQIASTTLPSGTTINKTWGTVSLKSDTDDQSGTSVTGQTIIVNGLWNPFGGAPRYWTQYNKRNGNSIVRRTSYNHAYRPKSITYEESTGADIFLIDHDEDTKGRITERVFGSAHADMQDAYYTYDDMDRVLCDSAASGTCPTSGSNLKSNFNGSPSYNASGERVQLLHSSLDYGTQTYPYTYVTGTDQLDTVGIGTGTREVEYTFNDHGMRTSEDDSGLSYDKRDFTYDERGNLLTVRAKYKPTSGSTWRYYTVTNTYDERNHRIFRSFLDEDTDDEAQWFFYYDLNDRLVEVKHVPDTSDTNTYSLFQFFWMRHYPVHYYQVDYPGATTTKRYFHADELGRPLEAWSFPSSGDTARVWAINPDVFGWDDVIVGSALFQPLRFPGQEADHETVAWEDHDTPARPALNYNHARHYDPFTGMYLQTDPRIVDSWASYNYASSSPVRRTDRDGLYDEDGFGQDSGHCPFPGQHGGGGGGGGGGGRDTDDEEDEDEECRETGRCNEGGADDCRWYEGCVEVKDEEVGYGAGENGDGEIDDPPFGRFCHWAVGCVDATYPKDGPHIQLFECLEYQQCCNRDPVVSKGIRKCTRGVAEAIERYNCPKNNQSACLTCALLVTDHSCKSCMNGEGLTRYCSDYCDEIAQEYCR